MPILYAACADLGVAFVAFSPVARGALGGKLRDPSTLPASDFRKNNPRFVGRNWERNLARIDTFVALAKRLERDPGELALAWVLAQGPHILAIPGTRYSARLDENLGALDVRLSAAEVAELSAAIPPGAASGTRYPAGGMGAVYL